MNLFSHLRYHMPVCYLSKTFNVMRITALLCMLTFLCASATVSHSQVARLSFHLNGITLGEALEIVKQQSDYSFWYRNEEIDLNKRVSVHVQNQSIQQLLDELLAAGLPAGCSFLDENPTDRLVVDNFYTSEKDAVAAVDATYETLNSLYNRLMYMLAELPTDNMKNGLGMPNANLQDLEFLRFNSQNTFIKDMWKNSYAGISRANTAIEKIPGIKMNADKQNQCVGEAKFLRALYYFNLVRFFGDYHYYDYPAVHQVRRHDGVRDNRYKLIHFYGEANARDAAIDCNELYDLQKDPNELHNLYGDPAYDAIAQRLQKQLDTYRTRLKVDEY